jgi:signal transduction histidine kinase
MRKSSRSALATVVGVVARVYLFVLPWLGVFVHPVSRDGSGHDIEVTLIAVTAFAAGLVALLSLERFRRGRTARNAVLTLATVALTWRLDSVAYAVGAALLLATLLRAAATPVLVSRGTKEPREHQEPAKLRTWLTVAAAVGVVGALSAHVVPTTNWWPVAGAAVQLLVILLLLAGSVAELFRHSADQAQFAAEIERRRLARDLHDGAVQEIGYIWAQSRQSVVAEPAVVLDRIRGAAERAMHETRHAVAALSAPERTNLSEYLSNALLDVGSRLDVALQLNVDPRTSVSGDTREALVRIAREAMVNASRHGAARAVAVTVAPGLLEVVDDGAGFDFERGGRPGGFGLQSMKDRAEGLAGRFELWSSPGVGTTVRVTW